MFDTALNFFGVLLVIYGCCFLINKIFDLFGFNQTKAQCIINEENSPQFHIFEGEEVQKRVRFDVVLAKGNKEIEKEWETIFLAKFREELRRFFSEDNCRLDKCYHFTNNKDK